MMVVSRHQQGGFTLAELAITVVIMGLLLGGLIGPISRQVDQGRISETRKLLEIAREALLGYAVINKTLPCPDTTGDGLAEATCPTAATQVGNLPWATLGLPEADSWGTRFRYGVSPGFTTTIALTSVGALSVNQRGGTKTISSLAGGAAPAAAAVILSFGKNGYGGTMADGSAAGIARAAVPATNVDETTNAAAGTSTFSIRTPIDPSNTCSDTVGATPLCEFDDQLLWLAPTVIIGRMVAAGQLP